MIKFKSINRPSTVYTISTKDSYSSYQYNIISNLVKEYNTYGDGMTQHSEEYNTIIPNIKDFLQSLSSYIHTNNGITDIEEFYFWPKRSYALDDDRIKFFINLKYTEGKTLYYHIHENKTSRADSKRYDKRWNLVDLWHDGSMDSVIRLCNNSYSNILEKILLIINIAKIYAKETGCYIPKHDYIKKQLGDSFDGEEAAKISNIFEMLNILISSFRKYKDSLYWIERDMNNLSKKGE